MIDRERVTERETVGDTVRREHVTVEEDYDTGRATGGTHARRPGASEATSEGSVETTQAGAVRPAMRREDEAAETGDGESWDQLRGDIRDAAERTRR